MNENQSLLNRIVRKIAFTLLWLLVGLVIALLFLPVAVSPFITAVPLWPALVLALIDAALLVVIPRYVRAPLVIGLALIGGFAAVDVMVNRVLARSSR
jgi:hypothetical protein